MTDLIDLITVNRRYELEDALAARKARRLIHSQSAKQGHATRYRNNRKSLRVMGFGADPALVSDRAAARLGPTGFDPGDWDPCPRCNFISVACDCDSQSLNSPGRFGPRPDGSETRPVHTMKGS